MVYQIGLSNKSHLWFVSWDVIHHKRTPSETLFFPFIFATGSSFHFWAHIIFIAASNIFVFMNYFLTKYYSPSWLVWLQFLSQFSSNTFLQSLNYHTCTLYSKAPLLSATKSSYGKKNPTEGRSRFYESAIPVRWDNLFSYKQVLVFNGIILLTYLWP